jgi:hypothetical protein
MKMTLSRLLFIVFLVALGLTLLQRPFELAWLILTGDFGRGFWFGFQGYLWMFGYDVHDIPISDPHSPAGHFGVVFGIITTSAAYIGTAVGLVFLIKKGWRATAHKPEESTDRV